MFRCTCNTCDRIVFKMCGRRLTLLLKVLVYLESSKESGILMYRSGGIWQRPMYHKVFGVSSKYNVMTFRNKTVVQLLQKIPEQCQLQQI